MNKKVLVLGFNLKTYFCKQIGMKTEENEEYEVFENDHFFLYKPHGLRNNHSDADRIRLNAFISKESSYHQVLIVCQFGRFDQINFMIKEFYENFSYYFNIVTLIIIDTEKPSIELQDQTYLNENLICKFNLNTILYFSEFEKQQIQDQICSIVNQQESVYLDIKFLKLQEEYTIDYNLLHKLNQFNNNVQQNNEIDNQQKKRIDIANIEKWNKQYLFYGCFY